MKEPIVAYIVCLLLTVVCALTAGIGGWVNTVAWFAAVFSLMAVPLVIVRRIHPRDEVEAGIAIAWSARDLLTGLAVLAILFVPVALGNHFVRTEIQGLAFSFSWDHYANLSLGYEVLVQIVAVALPEEFFYRGYLQTAFMQFFRGRPQTAKAAPALAIGLASICFAIVHLPTGGLPRLLTFFPGLLFGTIRHKTGGLLGCIACHAGSNLMMLVMNVHYT